MPKKLNILSFLFLLASFCSVAQIKPLEGSRLNYRIIGFSFPSAKGATGYRVDIAAGNYYSEDSFYRNIVVRSSGKKNKIIAEVPAFGKPYTWRVTYSDAHAIIKKSVLYHFETMTTCLVDPDSTRLRMIGRPAAKRGIYVFIDASKTLYDMDGQPVWYLPDIEGLPTRVLSPRDMKSNNWGTITFMMNEKAYEISYDGTVLWKEPSENFDKKSANERIKSLHHHEFTRLDNGHYMSLGMERVLWAVDGTIDLAHVRHKNKLVTDSNGRTSQKVFAGRIEEFDEKHNLVWSWSAADYFKESDLYYRRRANGLFQIGNTHENGFYFDEKAKNIYVSFRNIHRIIKISYPSGKVLSTYGQLYAPGDLELKNDLFCGQHHVSRSRDGYIYLFNNNSCNRLCGQLPTILMMKEPDSSGKQLVKVWEYECTLDNMNDEEKSTLRFETGGSVYQLPDRSLLCCMAGNYSKVFIVNHDKQILWSALPEKWDANQKKWNALPGYRASMITRRQLEDLIWGTPTKKK